MKKHALAYSFFLLSILSATVLIATVKDITKAQDNSTAKSLSKTMLPKEQYKHMIDAIVQTGQSMAKNKMHSEKNKTSVENKSEKLNKSEKIDNMLRKHFSYDYFITINSQTMMKKFSNKELKYILNFYETSIGKQWVQHTPNIITETMTNVQNDLFLQIPKMMANIDVELLKSKKTSK